MFKMEYEDPMGALRSGSVPGGPGGSGPDGSDASYNVEILLDASGSMANVIGSKTRMELAKEAIRSFASSLPAEANAGLRVYGHKGTGSKADKAMSCASNELVYPIQPYEESQLAESLNQFNPAGWTPLAGAIGQAQKDLEPYKGEHDENVIFVVSDGMETCGGDPVQSAAALKASGISPIVHIIGFDVASKEEQQLQDVAEAAGGTYTNARNHEQLKAEFDWSLEDAKKWQDWWLEEKNNLVMDKFGERSDINKIEINWKVQNRSESHKMQHALLTLQTQGKINSPQQKQDHRHAQRILLGNGRPYS
ncbi:Ca-activated chloride channel family protein [Edaphobacillus lindanitolerans]|uniref:Ca-activated chloride channel family protein n=1 Tax=Edaphobacillus lindanitolerans TaxID=550447 RepID=A0A1U7PMS5_9BACI|nr:Ca-activated chloride channel family protein [Edaphobacillus lindanitolerans]